jgi:hypothetical protein
MKDSRGGEKFKSAAHGKTLIAPVREAATVPAIEGRDTDPATHPGFDRCDPILG